MRKGIGGINVNQFADVSPTRLGMAVVCPNSSWLWLFSTRLSVAAVISVFLENALESSRMSLH